MRLFSAATARNRSGEKYPTNLHNLYFQFLLGGVDNILSKQTISNNNCYLCRQSINNECFVELNLLSYDTYNYTND